MAQPEFVVQLVEKIPRVSDIVTFRMERPSGWDYQAGQWFAITFPGPSGPYDHHFSHSSSPTEPYMEFTTRLRGSEFKNALDALPLGSELEVDGPYGSFTLGPHLDRVAFLAGGIGITCVRSILRWLSDEANGAQRPMFPRQIVLFFANRSEDEIPFADELVDFEAKLSGFRTVHVISRPGGDWTGYEGHLDGSVIVRELADPIRWTYYVSGPPSFGQAMQEAISGLGVSAGSVKIERFEGYE
jgi:ferredoxin-NADP reductase